MDSKLETQIANMRKTVKRTIKGLSLKVDQGFLDFEEEISALESEKSSVIMLKGQQFLADMQALNKFIKDVYGMVVEKKPASSGTEIDTSQVTEPEAGIPIESPPESVKESSAPGPPVFQTEVQVTQQLVEPVRIPKSVLPEIPFTGSFRASSVRYESERVMYDSSPPSLISESPMAPSISHNHSLKDPPSQTNRIFQIFSSSPRFYDFSTRDLEQVAAILQNFNYVRFSNMKDLPESTAYTFKTLLDLPNNLDINCLLHTGQKLPTIYNFSDTFKHLSLENPGFDNVRKNLKCFQNCDRSVVEGILYKFEIVGPGPLEICFYDHSGRDSVGENPLSGMVFKPRPEVSIKFKSDSMSAKTGMLRNQNGSPLQKKVSKEHKLSKSGKQTVMLFLKCTPVQCLYLLDSQGQKILELLCPKINMCHLMTVDFVSQIFSNGKYNGTEIKLKNLFVTGSQY